MFRVTHPRRWPSQFGIDRIPSRATLARWIKSHGFPPALTIPKGHYVEADVAAWFAAQRQEVQP
jgi:hypothetical protein